ncbi:MAG: hypothetical protein R6V04_08345 [bacterium]
MMKKLAGLFLLMGIATTVFCQEWGVKTHSAFNEKWYTYWALGASNLTFVDDDVQKIYEDFEDLVDTRLTINLDLLGLYLPVTNNAIAGVIINGTGDRFEFDDHWFQENYITYSLSAIHYLSTFGRGIFIRADGGLAAYNYQDSDGTNENLEETGYGLLVGSGYSFEIGRNSILLNLNFSHRNIDDVKLNVISLNVGGLF